MGLILILIAVLQLIHSPVKCQNVRVYSVDTSSDQSVQVPQSPCPQIFQYQYGTDGWTGLISVPPPNTDSRQRGTLPVKLEVGLRISGQLPSKYVGKLELAEDMESVRQKVLQGDSSRRVIKYRVHFPTTTNLPIVTLITLNGNSICVGNRRVTFFEDSIPSRGRIVTTITLEHRFYPNSNALNIESGFNNDFNGVPNKIGGILGSHLGENNTGKPPDSLLINTTGDGGSTVVERPQTVQMPHTFQRPQILLRPKILLRPQTDQGPQTDQRSQIAQQPQTFQRPQTDQGPQTVQRPQTVQQPQTDQGPQRDEAPQTDQWPQIDQQPQTDQGPQTVQGLQTDQWPPSVQQPQTDEGPQTVQRPQTLQGPIHILQTDQWPQITQRPQRPSATVINSPPQEADQDRLRDLNSKCGKPAIINRLIINGERSTRGSWPWLVALFNKSEDGVDIKFICSGTLISEEFVLTAAHCLTADPDKKLLKPHRVLLSLGKFSLLSWTEPGAQLLDVNSVYIHPDYNPNVVDADIALLRMNGKAVFNEFVQPACLWSFRKEHGYSKDYTDLSSLVGKSGSVMGWGRNELGVKAALEPTLTRVPVVSKEVCYTSNKAIVHLISNRTLCAGSLDGSGPCNGDSGGGLMFHIKTSDGDSRWYLRGIVSTSLKNEENLCDLYNYVLYTDVEKFDDWIWGLIPLHPSKKTSADGINNLGQDPSSWVPIQFSSL